MRLRTRFLLVGVVAVGFIAGLGFGGRADRFEPAGQGQPTFLIDDLRIQYPRLIDDGQGTRAEPAEAQVWFSQRWSTDAYPGAVDCELTLTAGGSTVGTLRFQASSLTSFTPIMGPGLTVPVRAEPTTGEGSCEAGVEPSERGVHVIDEPAVEFQGDMPRLVGSVDWSGVPATSACSASVVVGGEARRYPFTVDAPDGYRGVIALLPPSWTDVSVDSVECAPFTAEGQR
jgi:hypothetical protein